MDDIELCDYATAQKAIQACKEALELSEKQHTISDKGKPNKNIRDSFNEMLEDKVAYYKGKQPAQEYLTRAQQVIRANNSAQEPVAWIKEVELGYMKSNIAIGKMDYRTNLGLKPEPDDVPLYTHPAPSEPFIGGSVCPSCGNHSLFKTDKSEWCVTHKCLWQSDYPPSWQGLSDDENEAIIQSIWEWGNDFPYDEYRVCIEQALKEKNGHPNIS